MNFKNILLVIAIIVVVIGAFSFLMSHQASPKIDTKITVTSAANLTEGDNISFQLTDINGTPIANQTLNTTVFESSGKTFPMVLHTDANGKAGFEVNSTMAGQCVVKIKFAGNDKYDGSNATQNIMINKKVVKITTNSSSILQRNSSYQNRSVYTTTDTNSYSDGSGSYSGRSSGSGSGSENVITVEDY